MEESPASRHKEASVAERHGRDTRGEMFLPLSCFNAKKCQLFRLFAMVLLHSITQCYCLCVSKNN